VTTAPDTRVHGPGSDLDPFSDDFLTGPFPALAVLRPQDGAVYPARFGMTIARMEGQGIIRALTQRVRAFTRDGDPRPRLNGLRGLASLPVRVVPA